MASEMKRRRCAYRPCPAEMTPGTTRFSFPKDLERSKTWLRLCNREDLLNRKLDGYALCEKHFEDGCFSRGSTRKRLFANAIPTLFLHKVQHPFIERRTRPAEANRSLPQQPESSESITAHHLVHSLVESSPEEITNITQQPVSSGSTPGSSHEWLLMKTQEDEHFLDNIIWTDEAKFTKNGVFNSHYWASENPHAVRQRGFQEKWQFNVFCAIKNDSVFYIEFYDENLKGTKYVNLLRNGIQLILNNRPGRELVWYQMDGAPPHNFHLVGEALTEIFEDRWIGNNGPFRWPVRTPDGNPLDYFVWGYIKNMVYSSPVTTKEDMQSRVRAAFNSLSPESIRRATHDNLLKRLHVCLSRGGDVFEHILKYDN